MVVLGVVAAQCLDHLHELRFAPPSAQVITIDRDDDDMLKAHLRRTASAMCCGSSAFTARGMPVFTVAEGAGAGAGIAQDHHRRVLLGPALADIRAGRFLADRVQALRRRIIIALVSAEPVLVLAP